MLFVDVGFLFEGAFSLQVFEQHIQHYSRNKTNAVHTVNLTPLTEYI